MADEFTPREQELMAAAWQCFEEQPKIDYEKMAKLVNMSNPRSASNAWAAIKKKLVSKAARTGGGDEGGENGDTPKPKATPRKRGKKAAEEDDANGESPAKKAKATPKNRGGKKAAAEAEEDTTVVEGETAAVKAEETDELV